MFMNYDHDDSVKNIEYHSTIRNLYYYHSCASSFIEDSKTKRREKN